MWQTRDAVVLVPILSEREDILLTVRSHGLASHAGQVAFPGGTVEHGDRTAVDTALRETYEEVAIPPGKVRPLGFLDCYVTITGFRVVPVVGWVEPFGEPQPNPVEVSAVFTIPLAHALDVAQYRHHQVTWRGQTHEVPTLAHPDHFIWGATAAILDGLRWRLEAADQS